MGPKVAREFDSYGNPVKITSQGQTVWELTGAGGRVTTTRLGGKLTATTSLDAQGFLQNQATVKAGSPNIRDFGYSFNAATGNLDYRISGLTGLKESFEYDALDRLRSVKEGASQVQTMDIKYMDNGNILSKTGLGTFVYDEKRPHAVALVDYNLNLMPSTVQSVTYNAFNKANCLKDTIGSISYQLDITYGPDQQRCKSVLKKNGGDVKTIIFADDYEKFIEIDNNNVSITRELYYIGAPDGLAAIYVKPQNGQANMYYVHTDHLGSIVSLTDSAGVAVFKASYDAWGKQTVSLNTINFYRGYTGHEHLPEFGLINMNGRMYDPVVGRFLSPDNYVQAADFSQSYNRYSYCVNNTVRYTDPSGEFLPLLVYAGAAVIGGGLNVWSNWDNIKKDPWSSLGYFGSGAVGGAVSVANPALGGSITASGNIATDVAFGNMPKFKSAGDVLMYGASKALDGLGAAGSGQLAKNGYALIKNWAQDVTFKGAAQIVSSETGLFNVMGAEVTVTQTAVLEPVAGGVLGQAAKVSNQYLYHYTSETAAQNIVKTGLKTGKDGFVYLTNKGGLSPLQAQIELALPANRALPTSILRIDASGLSPSIIRSVQGNLPGMGAGGGTEFLFNQNIPAHLLQIIK